MTTRLWQAGTSAAVVACLWASPVWAQPAQPPLLQGFWQVQVDGSPRHRTLWVEQADDKGRVTARYHWSDEWPLPAQSQWALQDGQWRWELTTPAGSRLLLSPARPVGDASERVAWQGRLVATHGAQTAVRVQPLTAPEAEQLGRDQCARLQRTPCVWDAGVQAMPGRTLHGPFKHKIHLVWMGGNDCPPCVDWRRAQLPVLQAAPEFAQITFSYVSKSIHSPVPLRLFLPSEVRPYKDALDQASQGAGGSPQFALLVDGQVYDYQFGTQTAATLLDMVRYIETGLGAPPYQRCLQRKAGAARVCERT